jgi:hypothetical protein
LKAIEERAYELGSAKHANLLTKYYDKAIKYLIYGNVLKNNTYPLSVSAERVFKLSRRLNTLNQLVQVPLLTAVRGRK